MIQLKRVYEEPSEKDGMRVLVERLWPRGLTREGSGSSRRKKQSHNDAGIVAAASDV